MSTAVVGKAHRECCMLQGFIRKPSVGRGGVPCLLGFGTQCDFSTIQRCTTHQRRLGELAGGMPSLAELSPLVRL